MKVVESDSLITADFLRDLAREELKLKIFREDQGDAPSPLAISRYLDKSIKDFIFNVAGGQDSIIIVPGKDAASDIVYVWDREKKIWDERSMAGPAGSVCSDIYHVKFKWLVNENYPGYPTRQAGANYRRIIRDEMVAEIGQGEKVLSKFDGFDYHGVSRFLYGNRGVCSIFHKDGKWHFTEGGENRPEYLLRADINGPVADDEEFDRMSPGLIALLSEYGEGFEETEEERAEAVAAGRVPSYTGNHWVDTLMNALASSRVPVELRNFLIMIGGGGEGKGSLIKLILMMLGPRMVNISVEASAFTTGSEANKGIRQLALRKELMNAPICLAPEGEDSTDLDESFIKKGTSPDETTQVGGLFKDNITVNINCLMGMALNDMPRISDASMAVLDRLTILKFRRRRRGTATQLSQAQLADKFKPYFATFRRLLFEHIKALVLHHNCILPRPNDRMMQDWRDVTEIAQWDLRTEIARCFTADTDRNLRDRQMILGQESLSNANNAVKVRHTDSEFYNGMFLTAQILQTISGNNRIKRKTLKTLLEKMGFHKNARGFYQCVHTRYLVEQLWGYYGSEESVKKVINALYNGSGNPDDLLTPDMLECMKEQGDRPIYTTDGETEI